MSGEASLARHPKRWRALAVSQIAAFMALLDVSIVNVALPSIAHGLGASQKTVQWVVSGYALTFGLALIPAGRLGDVIGRRRMLMLALAAFVVTSALTGAAPNVGLLIAARLLQGIAGGMLIPQNSGLVQELFRDTERGKAFGILGATIGLATAAGPIVGGLILTAFTGPEAWRWVFYVNVPIGLVALVTSPNLTLTLQHVSVWMAGAAGGALQTAQRVGAAIGAAVLATIFYRELVRTEGDYAVAVSDALLFTVGLMLLTLLIAAIKLRRHRPPHPDRDMQPAPPRPGHM